MKFYRFATREDADAALDRITEHVRGAMESDDLIWLPKFKCFISREQAEALCAKQRGWSKIIGFRGDFYIMAHPEVDCSDIGEAQELPLDGRFFSEEERREARSVIDFMLSGES